MNNLAAALALAGRGVPVLPLVPGGKAPLARLVPNGVYGATLDPELVTRWLTRFPDANIGAPTGLATFDVLDVDVKPAGAGWPAFNQCKAAGLLPEPLFVNGTPSGGIHAGYVGTDQACGSLKRHFLDWKSQGGYVVMPPSVVNGVPYRLISERPHARHQLNWASVREFLDPPRPVNPVMRRESNPVTGTGIDHLAVWLSGKTRPGRNQSLFWAAARATENGATEAELHELYRAMQFGDEFDERQAARTVADAYRITTRRST